MAQRKKVQPVVVSPSLSGIPVGALVVGILGVILSLVPWYGMPLGAAALVLGIVGLVKKAPHRRMAIAGIVLGGAAILFSIAAAGIFLIIFAIAQNSSN